MEKAIKEKLFNDNKLMFNIGKGTEAQLSHSATAEDIRKRNNTEKYGVPYSISSKEVRSKIETSVKENDSYEKVSRSVRKVYSTGEPQKKCKDTLTTLYGVDNINKLQEYKSFKVNHKISKASYRKDDIMFDSKWELAYYIYEKDRNKNIVRNNVPFKYISSIDNKEHLYYPDFNVDGLLVEIKGDHFLKNGIYYDSWKDKEKIFIENNIKVMSYEDIKPIMDYLYNKYGKNVFKQYKVKTDKDFKRKIISINSLEEASQYKNDNIKLSYFCKECNLKVITSFINVDYFKDMLCKRCRLKKIDANQKS